MSFRKGKKKSRSNTSLRNMECSSIPIWNERPIYSLLPKRHGYGKRTGFQASVAIQRCMKRRLIPYITKDMRILDFGAGQKDYATILEEKRTISLTPLNSSTAKMERTSLMKRKSGKTVLPYARPCRTTGCTMWLCAIAC